MDDTQTLAVTWVATGALFENPANPRHNENAVAPVAASIRKFGWQQPIVAKRSGEVIAGHTRLMAARELGHTQVPVVYFNGSDLDALAFGIADNKSHEFATWDEGALVKILETLQKEDALDATGFVDEDITNLLRELGSGDANAIDDPGPAEPPATPVTRPGDLWQLGRHLLLCGDSKNPDSYKRLLGADKVSLISTDPPYCVAYTGKNRPIHDGKSSGKDWSHVYREIDILDLGEFIDAVFTASLPYLAEHAPVYCWHAHVQQPVIAAAFENHGLLLHQILVWKKPTAVFGHSYYHWQHEPCAFGWRKGSKPQHGSQILTSVWECDWEGKARVVNNEHPTQKPLRIFEIPLEQHTAPGDVVLEPFSGSGSQLIACEKLQRRCRAIEISPAFVDVAIRRWQEATKKEATLSGDERSYAAIRDDRLLL